MSEFKFYKAVDMIDSIRVYLNEIGRYQRLTHQQEIVLAKQVQQMIKLLAAKKAIAQKLCRQPTPCEWSVRVELSESDIALAIQQGQRARNEMVRGNLRLVVSISKKYQNRGLELLDLIQEGTIGLQRAVEKFDPTKGCRFSTYAYWWISQAISRAVATDSSTIRIPIHVVENLNRIKKVQRDLAQKLGRNPSLTEIANRLGWTPKRVLNYIEYKRKIISLQMSVGEDRDSELGDFLEDKKSSGKELLERYALSLELEPMLAKLTPLQREILTYRYGLDDGEPLSLACIGKFLNLSRERVRQIEHQALNQLRFHQQKTLTTR